MSELPAPDYGGIHCTGERCPSRTNCQRTTFTGVTAAFPLRREPGDSACNAYLPINPLTTYKEMQS